MTRTILAALAAITLSAAGCGGDMVQQVMRNPELQQQVMQAIAGDADASGAMADQLLANDQARTVVFDRMLASGDVTQALVGRLAQDRTAVDAVINLAVQDSSMREHVLSLFKGMQMAGMGR